MAIEKITLRKDPEFISNFKKKNVKFRIEAVIHDGQWYTVDKWAKVAYTSIQEIINFIKETDYLIEGQGSYRVDKDEIITWYYNNNLDISTPIVPNNFIPKIWAGKTEVEHFINTPKRLIHTLSITTNDLDLLDRIKKMLKGYARYTIFHKNNQIKVYTTSPEYIENYLSSKLSKDLLNMINFRIKYNIWWRDIADFEEDFVVELLNFYMDYAKGILKPHFKTMEIFLPSSIDRETQIQEWIIRAAEKFNEKCNVPFSGYLANVLQRWPYDLPNFALGTELAKFQRERSKAITKLTKENNTTEHKEEEIQLLTPYSKEDYLRLLDEHNRWVSMKTVSSLNWEDKNIEKVGEDIFSEEHKENDCEFSHKITIALLETAIELNDLSSLSEITENYTDNMNNKINVPSEFKQLLKRKLLGNV